MAKPTNGPSLKRLNNTNDRKKYSFLRNIYWYFLLPMLIISVVFTVMDFGLGNQKYYTNKSSDQTMALLQLGQQPHGLEDQESSEEDPTDNSYIRETVMMGGGTTTSHPKFQFNLPQPPPLSPSISRIPLPPPPPSGRPSSLEAKVRHYETEIQKRVSHSLGQQTNDINLEIRAVTSTDPVFRNSLERNSPPRQQTPKLVQNLMLPPPRLTNSTTIVLVLSAEWQYAKRQAIRETWSQGHDNVYFVVGHSNCPDKLGTAGGDPTCRNKRHMFLYHEQVLYQDLLEVPMEEYYQGLPDKVVYSYQFILQNLPHVRWFVKVDDDMFARVTSLERYVEKYNPSHPLVIGQIIQQAGVAIEGKWVEHNYKPKIYPWWPQGSAGHILSHATARYIATHDKELFRYQGEDTSIGIWLQEAVDIYGHIDHVTYIHASPSFISNLGPQACADPTSLMVGHDFSPSGLQRCFRSADEGPRGKVYKDLPGRFPPYSNIYTNAHRLNPYPSSTMPDDKKNK